MSVPSKFKLGLVQMLVGTNRDANLRHAQKLIAQAVGQGSQIVVLPECFNSPYGPQHFPQYAEDLTASPTVDMLRAAAREHQIYLIGGSLPERAPDGRLFNTSPVISPSGEILGLHRKLHLFDIDIPGRITFRESLTLSAGSQETLVDTPYGKIGVGICYDIRFPELAMRAARRGADLLVYPGAFNLVTGPLHWELLQRARAVDNQVFVATASPARGQPGQGYQAWGHSMCVGPDGVVLGEMDETEGVLVVEVDRAKLQEMRDGIPVSTQRRFDIYPDVAGV